MADNIATGVANSILALILNGTAFAGFATPYAQLHTGLPGAAGTANVAGNSTRQACPFATAPSGGVVSNSSAITWTSVPATETYTHISLWSAASGGTFICSGSLAVGSVLSGQNFSIGVGALTVSLPVAA